jgi:hypothetical protein
MNPTPPETEALLLTIAQVAEELARSIRQRLAPVQAPVPMDLTVPQLAVLFGKAESTVRGWIEEGKFPGSYLLHRRQYRVPPAAVAEFQRRAANGSASAEPAGDLSRWRAVAPGRNAPTARATDAEPSE